MLYHLLAPLARQHIIFNLFNYITFRAAGATVTALLLAFIVGPKIIAKLREHRIGQIVRAEGPTSHHGKRGTPTMGGVIIILATLVPTLLWARLDNRYVIVTVVATLWMGLIGFLDDYLKIVRGQSQGLVARWKLVGQVSFGIGLGVYLLLFPLTTSVDPNATQLPLFKYIVWILPWPIYLAFVTFVTTASSNAVNLTDGLDGLAAGLTVIIGGAWKEPGNAGPAAEFHIHLDPDAAKRVFQAELHPLLIPLDVTRKLVLEIRVSANRDDEVVPAIELIQHQLI